jgi:hypothetical protein
MTSRLLAAPALLTATDELNSEGREVNSHTLLGLGLMACVLLVLWLIGRSRARG